MSAVDSILNGIEAVFPKTTVLVEAARKYAPLAEAALPVVVKAIEQGPEAYAAAKAAAPELFAAVADFATAAKAAATGSDQPATDHEVATFSAHIAGIDPPGWTHEDTQRWWDRASRE